MAGATNLVDALGTPIAVGAQVRFTGLVTSVAPTDTHYGEVSVTPTYPVVPKVNMGILNDIKNGIPQATVNANPVNISPAMLVVGLGTGGNGMSQSPWVTDIDGGNKNLYNVASITTGPVTVTGDVNITGAFRVNGVALPGQSPWLQNVNAANFTLTNVASISSGPVAVTGNVNVTGNYLVNGVPIQTQTPWQQNINGGGFTLTNVATVAASMVTATTVNVTGSFQVNGVNVLGQTPWGSNIDAANHSLTNIQSLFLAGNKGVLTSSGWLGLSGNVAPAYAVDAFGDINITGSFRVNGISITAGGGVQTPWLQDVNANSKKLLNVGAITSIVSGAALAFATPSNTATITGAGDATFHSVIVGVPATGVTLNNGGGALYIKANAPTHDTALYLSPTAEGNASYIILNNGVTSPDALVVASGWLAPTSAGIYLWGGQGSTPANTITRLQFGEYTGPTPGTGSLLGIDFLFNDTVKAQILPAGTIVSAASGAALAFATPSNAATITGAGDAVFHSVTTAGPGVISTTSANPNYQLIITQSNASNRAGLDLVNSAGKDFELSIQPNGVCTLTGSPGTYVIVNVASGPGLTLDPTNAILNPSPTGTLFFQTGPAPSTRMTVNSAGNVTINAPDSGTALTVAGEIASTAAGAALAFATPSNAATITGAGDAVFHSVTAPAVTIPSAPGSTIALNITQADSAGWSGLQIAASNGQHLYCITQGTASARIGCELQNLVISGQALIVIGSAGAGSQIELQTDILSFQTNIASPKTRVQILSAGNVFINAPDSGTALTVAGPVSLTGAGGNISITNLPSVAPAAGSKQLWYDPADSNRVKFAA